MIQYSCSPSPFCGTPPVGAWESSSKKCVCSRCIQSYVWEKHHARVSAFFSLSLLQRPRERCEETDISRFLFNVQHAELVCYRCYLEACVQRFVVRLLCLPFQSTKAVYRNVKHLQSTIIPLRMFAWCLFICVCATGWARSSFKSRGILCAVGKLKVKHEETL